MFENNFLLTSSKVTSNLLFNIGKHILKKNMRRNVARVPLNYVKTRTYLLIEARGITYVTDFGGQGGFLPAGSLGHEVVGLS